MKNFTVGSLVAGKIIKYSPENPAYLVWILDTSLYATLPKDSALKELKIGETTLGAIKSINGARITLSQKIPQFTKKIIELELKNLIKEKGWEIKRANIKGNLGKILVKTPENLDFFELNRIFSEHKASLNLISNYYQKIKLFLIPKVDNPIQQIVEALRPAPVEKIEEIQQLPGKTLVYVQNGTAGLFIGKDGVNILTAKNILSRDIEILQKQ